MSIDDLRERPTWLLAGIVLLAAAWFGWASWNRVPQLGSDEEVYKTVDALFTAITTHDHKRLDAIVNRLADKRKSGSLPEAAADRIDEIVAMARQGNWQPAAEQLYGVILSQRRGS